MLLSTSRARRAFVHRPATRYGNPANPPWTHRLRLAQRSTTWSAGAALIAVLLCLIACGTTVTGRGALGIRGASQFEIDPTRWIEVSSPNFNIHTDLTEPEARDRARELEDLNAALLELAFKSKAPPTDKVEVVLFKNERDFRAVAPRKWSGGFARAVDLDDRLWIVVPATEDRWERRVLQHELTHRFVHYFMPGAPTWLNEGMAKFYETMDLDKRSAVIGEPPFPFAPFGAVRDNARIAMDELPDATVVGAMRPGVFYARNEHRAEVNYAAAWLLVSMLITGSPEEAAHFWAYVRALTQGATAKEAWDVHLASLPLDDRYDHYRRRGVIGVATVPYRRPVIDAASFTVRPMRAEEVYTLVASLVRNPKEAKNLVARALKEAPDSAEVHYWAGRVHGRVGDAKKAERALRKALSLSPSEPRYLISLAEVLYFIEEKKPKAARDLKSLMPEMEQLATLTDSASAQNTAAWYMADIGEVDRGLPLAQRSVELAPTCWECLDTLARLVALKGDVVTALAIQRRAVSAFPGERPPDDILAALAKYEEASVAQLQQTEGSSSH